ncbi:MAG TPA: hypothetical protein VJX74_22965 [Blastocatellia bacterium]|nr:hypothetical protein [Blastocatellia bacterium]
MKYFSNTVLAIILSIAVPVCTVACARAAVNSDSSDGSKSEPAPPAIYLDTTYERPTGRTIQVKGGGNLQAALDGAAQGDVIALESGATFIGNFTLPAKNGSSNKWIIIRSSTEDAKLPQPGTRVVPADAQMMPKLVSPNADPVLRTAPGAHHYRFIGVEFQVAAASTINYGLILLGDGGSKQNTLESVPHDLIIDRCYIHGNQTGNLRRGIGLNSARTAIIDSHISDCHEIGADSQAICGWNGPGPFKIVNNYLEGAGENVMFGGADPSIKDLVMSDIEFRRNTCSKPLSWKTGHPTYAGKHWSIKNVFELKNARRVVIDGNVFENSWLDAQIGFAILFTPRNQEGNAPWSTVEDVSFTNNIVRHAAGGINILGRDDNHQSEQAKRITVRNNLFEDIGGSQWGGNGRFLQTAETDRVVIDHNTIIHTGNIITAYGKPSINFIFTNNVVSHNQYGVIGDGAGIGNATLNQYFPNAVFKKNVIAGGRNSAYPADNFFPSNIAEAQFADHAKGDYRLGAASPYKSAGTDGKPIGCDMDAMKAATRSLESARSSL